MVHLLLHARFVKRMIRRKGGFFMPIDYTTHFTLRPGEVDFVGRWRPSSILTSMQDIATEHAEPLGFGRQTLLEQGLIWILSRTHVQMLDYPMMGDEVLMRTWAGVPNRFFFPRYFEMTAADGTPFGFASSLWLILDVNEHMVVPPSKCQFAFPDTSQWPAPLPLPERVLRVEGEALGRVREPVYTDLDINGHVNNTRYADWVCDALPLDILRTHAIDNLLLNYTREILPGCDVCCTLHRASNRFSLLGESADGAQIHFEAGGSLMPWHSDRRI